MIFMSEPLDFSLVKKGCLALQAKGEPGDTLWAEGEHRSERAREFKVPGSKFKETGRSRPR
jgi:hypothetical protein